MRVIFQLSKNVQKFVLRLEPDYFMINNANLKNMSKSFMPIKNLLIVFIISAPASDFRESQRSSSVKTEGWSASAGQLNMCGTS